jgi:hypothetical protein
MLQSMPPHWRRLISSLAYGGLVVLVVGLGYLTFQAVKERRIGSANHGGGAAAADQGTIPLIEVSAFSSRRDKSSDAERVTVSLRLRVTTPAPVDCYVYVLAHNDHVSPKIWGIWPVQEPGGAVTAGGHFWSSNPTSGQALRLSTSWNRISATIDHPLGKPPFETVTVYVVSPKGEILLARPFLL